MISLNVFIYSHVIVSLFLEMQNIRILSYNQYSFVSDNYSTLLFKVWNQ